MKPVMCKTLFGVLLCSSISVVSAGDVIVKCMAGGKTIYSNGTCDLTGFLGPSQLGVAPVNKLFDCFLPNASGVSYCKLECGRTVL